MESSARKAALARVTLTLALSHKGRGDLSLADFREFINGKRGARPNMIHYIPNRPEYGGEDASPEALERMLIHE